MSEENKTPDKTENQGLEQIAQAFLKEQRLKRRWSIFFKITSIVLIILFFIIIKSIGSSNGKEASSGTHTAMIEVKGTISANSNASAKNLMKALNKAFEESDVKGIVLKINSPGGSPVQSGMVYDEIMRLKKKHPEKPVYAAVEDICASGSYYIAAAADKIYVDKASLVGSIGVLINGFGVNRLMDKVGVERRLLTAGKYKGFLDTFSPQSPEQVTYAKDMLGKIHVQFINAVKEGRGKRLKDDSRLFTGLVFVGEDAVKLGLADGYGTVRSIAEDEFKAKDVVNYSIKDNFGDRLLKKFGTAVGYGAVKAGLDQETLRIE